MWPSMELDVTQATGTRTFLGGGVVGRWPFPAGYLQPTRRTRTAAAARHTPESRRLLRRRTEAHSALPNLANPDQSGSSHGVVKVRPFAITITAVPFRLPGSRSPNLDRCRSPFLPDKAAYSGCDLRVCCTPQTAMGFARFRADPRRCRRGPTLHRA